MGSSSLALLALGYLRTRLAFWIGDEVLLGVAFASQACAQSVLGFRESALHYLSLAKKCQPEGKESEYLRCYVTTGYNWHGLFHDLPLSISNGIESVSPVLSKAHDKSTKKLRPSLVVLLCR